MITSNWHPGKFYWLNHIKSQRKGEPSSCTQLKECSETICRQLPWRNSGCASTRSHDAIAVCPPSSVDIASPMPSRSAARRTVLVACWSRHLAARPSHCWFRQETHTSAGSQPTTAWMRDSTHCSEKDYEAILLKHIKFSPAKKRVILKNYSRK